MKNDVTKISLTYEDGTVSEISKGFVASVEQIEGNATITFTMVKMGGADLRSIVSSVIELGVKIGIFDDSEEDWEND